MIIAGRDAPERRAQAVAASTGSSTNMRARERVTKAQRLRRRREFLLVQRCGRSRHTRHFVVVTHPRADGGPARVGITVSRRVGNAVVRNHVKRRVREFFRHHQRGFPDARDFVFVAKTGSGNLEYADVVRELCTAVGITPSGRDV